MTSHVVIHPVLEAKGTIMSALSPRRPHIDTQALDLAHAKRYWTYATTLAGVYLSVGFLFYYAAKEKLLGSGAGTMPGPLRKEFGGSLIASVPGLNAAWTLLGATEAAVVVLLAVSLLRGEFMPTREKPALFAGLGLSMVAFGLVGVANNMVGDITTALTVFTYLGLTAVVMVLVRQMAPYRSVSWLSGFTRD